MHALPLTVRAVLALLATVAACYDFRFRRIPNWLNLSALILGFGLNSLNFRGHGAVLALEGVLLATAVYLPLYCLRGMGAGDVKLMAAVGALVGPGNWFLIFVVTALVGGAAAGVFALLKRRFTETCCNLYFLLHDLVHLRAPHRTNPQLDFRNPGSLRMPHGILIAVGSFSFLIATFMNRDAVLDLPARLFLGLF